MSDERSTDKDWRVKLMLAALGTVVAGGIAAGAVIQGVAAARDRRMFPPPGRLLSVSGVMMHLVQSGSPGSAAPTVVLETGLGGMSSAWGWIQPEIAKFAGVVSYDRAGMGWSAADPATSSGTGKARRLHDLLQATGIEGPYLLVGHSMGGLLVRIFNDLYPEKVAGIVMLDPCHPDQHLRSREIGKHMTAGFRMLKNVPLLTMIGYVRLTEFFADQPAGLPPRQVAESRSFLCSYDHLKSTNQDACNWDHLCAEVRSTRDLVAKPLTVLTAAKGLREGGLELQQELADLSTCGRQVLVSDADHVSLVTHREHAMTVVAEVRLMFESIKRPC